MTEFNPFESGLSRFVKMDKPVFVGKAALARMVAAGPRRAFVSRVIEATHATAQGGDSIIADGRVVGAVTSIAWGHRVGRNIAMGFGPSRQQDWAAREQSASHGKSCVDRSISPPHH